MSGYSLRYNVCALDQGMLQDRGREIVLLGVSDPSARDAQVTSLDVAMVAADLDGSGSDELVFVHRYPTTERGISTATVPRFQHSPLAAYVISVDGTEDRWSSPEWNLALPGSACPLDTSVSSLFPSVPVPASTEVRLAAGDWDADGREELYVSTGFDGNSSISRVHAIRDQGKWHLEAGPPETLAFSSSPIVTGGDFDGDNLVVRYTGNKELALGEPLPIVLVAAPPTKSGISQCYDDSCTSYGTEQGFSQSYGVAAGITASVSAGMNAADPFGIASASVMVTLGKEFEKTNTTTTFETHTQTFTNSCEEDGIIFQGTLYNCYEYEVIFGKPSLIGEHIRLNIPVDARVFKWTLGFYNDTIDPEYRIDPSILGHSIGDPESYMRKQQALDLASTYVGWAAGQEVAVGQGQGSNAVGISLVEEQATETTRSWSVSLDCEYSLFGAAWGHSIGVTGSDIYTIGLTEGTHYEGVVGDISDPAEYGEWSYSFGLLAYNRGVLSDANNEPIGLEEGHLPFQVLTYWTTPTGTGY